MADGIVTTLKEQAKNFQPVLRASAEEFEEVRRLPADLAGDLAKAGLFRMMTPTSIGGYEMAPGDIVDVLESLAYGDASVSWCVMIANTAALSAGYLEKSLAAEIYGDPEVITAGVFAPMGKAAEDGEDYIVSGQWQWGSGAANSRWIAGGCLIFRDGEMLKTPAGPPVNRMMIMPRDEVELLDTWYAQGLKGTGSGDFRAEKVRVPKTRSVSLTQDTPVDEGALYRFPIFGLLAVGVCSVALGNARAALDEIREVVKLKKPAGSPKPLSEQQITQYEIAKLEAQWRSARAFLTEAVEKNWAAAQGSGEISNELKAELRLACTNATSASADVARAAYDLGGGGSVYLSSSLQRRFRDAHVMTQHITCTKAIYGLAGRIMLGIETNSPLL